MGIRGRVVLRKESHGVRVELQIDPSLLATAQQKGIRVVNGHTVVYTKAHVRQAQEKLRLALARVRDGFFVPKPDAARVSVDFHFPYPKGTPKKDASRFSYMTQQPDADNVLKGLLDAMSPKFKVVNHRKVLVSRGYWDDDSQVCLGPVRKLRTPNTPKIVLTIDRVDYRTGITITYTPEDESQPLANG